MEIFRGVAKLDRVFERPVLTIGNFDGIHLGHRAILELVVSRAKALGGTAILYTFEPHPRRVLQSESDLKLLATFEQKAETLESLGVDAMIAEPFDLELARLTPERFIQEYIFAGVHPVEVYVGYDFHFGRDREGSMRLLTESGPHLGFSVTVVPEVSVDGRDVNSTRIRDLLKSGAVDEAGELLGRPFTVRGEVAEGDRRGRTIGFPTANLTPETEILPAPGVYFGHLRCLGDAGSLKSRGLHARPMPVVTNVGYRPTFNDGRDLVAEAHVLDFEGDLYGMEVDLTFEARIRAEQKFESVDLLKAQIGRDVALARSEWM